MILEEVVSSFFFQSCMTEKKPHLGTNHDRILELFQNVVKFSVFEAIFNSSANINQLLLQTVVHFQQLGGHL